MCLVPSKYFRLLVHSLLSVDCTIFLGHHQRHLLGTRGTTADNHSRCQEPLAGDGFSTPTTKCWLSSAASPPPCDLWHLRWSRWFSPVHEGVHHHQPPLPALWCRTAHWPWKVHMHGSFIYSGYFYSNSTSPLLFRGAPVYSIDIVLELTRLREQAITNWWTCPRSLHGG